MADLQKRGGYTPRRTREQRAYRLVMVGGTTGALGVVGLVLAIAGVWGAGIPIVLLLVAIACFGLFRGITSS
jgi:CHASE2 domain-containing sensor protein